jgi:hypothetical protein
VTLSAVIKSTGNYQASIVLHPEVIVPLTVNVVRNESDIVEEVPEELRAPTEVSEEVKAEAAE